MDTGLDWWLKSLSVQTELSHMECLHQTLQDKENGKTCGHTSVLNIPVISDECPWHDNVVSVALPVASHISFLVPSQAAQGLPSTHFNTVAIIHTDFHEPLQKLCLSLQRYSIPLKLQIAVAHCYWHQTLYGTCLTLRLLLSLAFLSLQCIARLVIHGFLIFLPLPAKYSAHGLTKSCVLIYPSIINMR